MTRVKRGVIKRKKHREIIKSTKGYYSVNRRSYRAAKEQLLKSLSYSYRDRKCKKREFRRLWIIRINAAARANGLSYNEFINGLKKANVEINRKVLSELAISDPTAFQKLAEVARGQLSALSS
ncbi:MAG: 50S ribosomal protein L20 [Actinobacteria bacterium]|nr:50S ribosomal protein L20 [Actinomycetota bacterium]